MAFIKALSKGLLTAVALAAISVIAQVSFVEGLTPLEGVPTKRQTNIESSDNQREDKFWEDVKSAGNKKAFEAYIKQYPNGRYADLARAKIDQSVFNSVQEVVKIGHVAPPQWRYCPFG